MTVKFKSFRKFLASAVTASIVATSIGPVASAASFPDVSESYKEAVDYLVSNEISYGLSDGTFGTDSNIKRADAALMIVRALGLENYAAPDSGFEDVPEYASKAVNVLKDLEIINGKTPTSFGSSDYLTRAEMAKIITLTYHLPVKGNTHPFKDVSPMFNDYVQALYQAGITYGTGETTYSSNAPTTRGQFALFMHRAEQFEVEVSDILVSDLNGVINTDNTVTIIGKAEGIDKVTVVLPNGNSQISLEAQVVNGEFSVTTEIPKAGMHEISVVDAEGNILYQGVQEEAEVSTAGLGKINFKDVGKR